MTDNPYLGLAEEHDGDARWAFGTDAPAPDGSAPAAADLGAGIDVPPPVDVDPADLFAYCLMLGDDALVYAQRLAEWVSNAPELEEDVALANIALDLLGQARVLLARAGHVEGAGRDEDRFAYFREPAEFRNVTLAELSSNIDGNVDGQLDFAATIAQLLLLSAWRLALLNRLQHSRDPVLAAVAAKGVKEITYHRDYAARWTLRLGDGTAESHRRMQEALDGAWPYAAELFETSAIERRLVDAGVAADPAQTRAEVDAVLAELLPRATLRRPAAPAHGGGRAGGRDGVHSAALTELLSDLQRLARAHPDASW